MDFVIFMASNYFEKLIVIRLLIHYSQYKKITFKGKLLIHY